MLTEQIARKPRITIPASLEFRGESLVPNRLSGSSISLNEFTASFPRRSAILGALNALENRVVPEQLSSRDERMFRILRSLNRLDEYVEGRSSSRHGIELRKHQNSAMGAAIII